MVFCKDCKHFDSADNGLAFFCMRNLVNPHDPVTGKEVPVCLPCYNERGPLSNSGVDRCGPHGKYYEEGL
jgi:hypothetical protein